MATYKQQPALNTAATALLRCSLPTPPFLDTRLPSTPHFCAAALLAGCGCWFALNAAFTACAPLHSAALHHTSRAPWVKHAFAVVLVALTRGFLCFLRPQLFVSPLLHPPPPFWRGRFRAWHTHSQFWWVHLFSLHAMGFLSGTFSSLQICLRLSLILFSSPVVCPSQCPTGTLVAFLCFTLYLHW